MPLLSFSRFILSLFLVFPVLSSAQQKLQVFPDYIYELSLYSSLGGGRSADSLFDGNASTHFMPYRHPLSGDTLIFFKNNLGLRIIVDLMAGNTGKAQLQKIRIFNKNTGTDTIHFFKLDGKLDGPDKIKAWQCLAQPYTNDTLASFEMVNANQSGFSWMEKSVSDSARFIMIYIKNRFQTITEVEFLGSNGNVKPVALSYSGTLQNKPVKDKLGTNLAAEMDTVLLRGNKYIRHFIPEYFYADDTVHAKADETIFNWNYFNSVDPFLKNYIDTLRAHGFIPTPAFKGAPDYKATRSANRDLQRNGGLPVNDVTDNPEDPRSYGIHGRLMWTFAAIYGNNAAIDTNLLQVKNMVPKAVGKKTIQTIEPGNEAEGEWWGKDYANALEMFAKDNAAYDGWEGRNGLRMGIKPADTSLKFVMPGLYSPKTDLVKTIAFLCRYLRTDARFIYDIVNIHHYPNSRISKPDGAAPTAEELVGIKGISTARDSTFYKLEAFAEKSRKYIGGSRGAQVEVALTEFGYDTRQTSPANINEAGSVTDIATPILAALDSARSQAVALLRYELDIAKSKQLSYSNQYWAHNEFFLDDSHRGKFFTTGYGFGDRTAAGFIKKPSWYYKFQLMNELGNYRHESTIRQGGYGSMQIEKFRHVTQADSIVYVLWMAGESNLVTKDYSFVIGIVAPFVTVKEFSFNSQIPISENKKVNLSRRDIILDVTETPKFVFVRETKNTTQESF